MLSQPIVFSQPVRQLRANVRRPHAAWAKSDFVAARALDAVPSNLAGAILATSHVLIAMTELRYLVRIQRGQEANSAS